VVLLVIVGVAGAGLIVNVTSSARPCPLALLAAIHTWAEPAWVGVPVIAPVEVFSVRPKGRDPEVTTKPVGLPEAVTW
jgi:hypothetical protein